MEEVCKFNISKEQGTLSYAGKQLIAREIELEKVRRIEMSMYRNTEDGNRTINTMTAGDSNKIPAASTSKCESHNLIKFYCQVYVWFVSLICYTFFNMKKYLYLFLILVLISGNFMMNKYKLYLK